MNDVLSKVTDKEYLKQIEDVIKFHGHLSGGAFIGIQMYNIAKKVLDIKDTDRVYANCETKNCMPDAFQVLGNCTTGNKRLSIKDYDIMAVTVNKIIPENEVGTGVRIVFDHKKAEKYPALYNWFMNIKKVPHEEVISDLIDAGDSIYSWKSVEIHVSEKKPKFSAVCGLCGESFIKKGADDENICPNCAEKSAE